MSPTELWSRVRFFLGRQRRMEELDEELRLHLELRERQLCDEGLSASEAARRARVQFGNQTCLLEESRDAWGWGWWDGLVGDLRHALRQWRANRLFALVVVLTLALGIGPNAAMFSVVNAVILRRLPVPHPERLVYVHTTGQPDGASNTGDSRLSFSYQVYSRLREQTDVVSDLMAFVPLAITRTPARFDDAPEETSANMVSGNFFTGLGVRAACGRLLSLQDEREHATAVVLSHAYWSRRFGGDCAVVGRKLVVAGVPFTIVGVAGEGFTGVNRSTATDLWVPLQDRVDLEPWGMRLKVGYMHDPSWWSLMLIGRLTPGVSEGRALAVLQPAFLDAAYAGGARPERAEKLPHLSLATTRGVPGLRDTYQRPLQLLLVMVAMVLIIACSNVGLLLVARNAARDREFAIRLALGGGRRQLLRQLLIESGLLVAAGAAAAWGFAVVATGALRAWSDLEVSLAPDRSVLLFTLMVGAVATTVFGLAPLRNALRAPANAGLRSSAAPAAQPRGWGRRAIVAVQVALCLVLLVPAGLLARTLRNLEGIPLGMRAEGLLVFGITAPRSARAHAEVVQFYRALLGRLRALPGVLDATVTECRIGDGWSNNSGVWVDGGRPAGAQVAKVRWNSVGPRYLHTLGIPLRAGRDLDDGDSETAQKVVLVNETFVRKYLPGGDALGHGVDIGGGGDAARFTIVGVAADSKYTDVREDPRPMAYFPYQQMEHISAMHVELRASGGAGALLPVVQKVVRGLAPDQPLEQPTTQQQLFTRGLGEDRLLARLAAFFGLLATILVATGLYGTLSYSVSRRTAELGVRMALGAPRGRVLWMVLRENLLVCAAGLAVGLPVAVAASLLLRSALYGVSPQDPATLGGAVAGLLGVALLASLLPARRATAVHPMEALRAE
jgi:predicted permease